jgi:hypothetical protein
VRPTNSVGDPFTRIPVSQRFVFWSDLSDSASPTAFGGKPFTLTKGAWPTSAGEIGLSDSLIRSLGASIGETIDLTDGNYLVVGRFEDSTDLRRAHAIVAPGTVSNPTGVHILLHFDGASVKRFEDTATADRFLTSVNFSDKSKSRFVNTMLVYLMTSVGMVEIGLLCAAGVRGHGAPTDPRVRSAWRHRFQGARSQMPVARACVSAATRTARAFSKLNGLAS